MKLFIRNCFSGFKNTLKHPYGNVETYTFFRGSHPGLPLPGAWRGERGREVHLEIRPPHSKILDPPLTAAIAYMAEAIIVVLTMALLSKRVTYNYR